MAADPGSLPIAVAATGLVTAVGLDTATSCAAIRAGLTRAAPVAGCDVLDPDSQTMVPAIGHAVWGLTAGAAPPARWLTLATHALGDLCRRADLPPFSDAEFWQATALLIVGPPLDDERFFHCKSCQSEAIQESYVQPLLRSLGRPFLQEYVHTIFAGRTGAARAIRAAGELLAEPAIARVIVVAADSLLDGYSLAWFQQYRRLKAAEQPTGLMPGEAGAALMLLRSGARCTIVASFDDEEDGEPLADGRQHGRALARVWGSALRAIDSRQAFSGDLIVDLNGESWRAYEFGTAMSQLETVRLGNCRTVMPAQAIGDIGAASALTGVVLAFTAFERRYAAADTAVVLSASSSGRVGAITLRHEAH